MQLLYEFDIALFRWLNSPAPVSGFLDYAIVVTAEYLIILFWAAMAVVLMASLLPRFGMRREKNKVLFFEMFLAMLIARYVIAEPIRIFASRMRPFEVLEGVRQLVTHSPGASFPSGHSTVAFAIATVIALHYPKTGIVFFLCAILIGLSRIAAGVHWPSDILGGLVLGVSIAWLMAPENKAKI